jgi:MFS family permease
MSQMQHSKQEAPNNSISAKSALMFVVLLGFVSLFADVTYEGARGITGPFLAILGANAAVVGLVAGLGELAGYALRLVTGYLADKTQRYWGLTIVGYGVNLFAVPLLALAGRWEVAAALMIIERVGKAIRAPARDAILSHATHKIGRGWGFGLHEFMDQIGAVSGPLIVAAAIYYKNDYQLGFGILLIPALVAMGFLITAKIIYPRPRDFEPVSVPLKGKHFPNAFWFYLVAVGLIAAGYADFALVGYHVKKTSIAADQAIPLLYAFAMGVDAVAALIFGRLYDRFGMSILMVSAIISAAFAPLVFLGGLGMLIFGMTLWGIGMGAQESIMRAAVADMVAADKRGSAYGIFNAGYGIFWFAGSALMGILYDVHIIAVVVFSVTVQLLSVVMFLLAKRSLFDKTIQKV